jgi:hypothetical protein
VTRQVRQAYIIPSTNTIDDLVREINQKLSFLMDRLDQMEGYRGTPSFHSNVEMNSNRITEIGPAEDPGDVPNFDQVALKAHDHTRLVDANANVTVKSVDNTDGSGDYLTVKAATTALPVVLVSADGTESAIGILVAAKGDTQYFQAWGGSAQYKGARLVLYGKDHTSTPGKAYLDFGGIDATGQIIFRHRLTSSFLTVFTMNYDGKLTLVGDVDTAAGKKYLVGGVQHRHTEVDFDLSTQLTIDKFVYENDDFVFFDGMPILLP